MAEFSFGSPGKHFRCWLDVGAKVSFGLTSACPCRSEALLILHEQGFFWLALRMEEVAKLLLLEKGPLRT